MKSLNCLIEIFAAILLFTLTSCEKANFNFKGYTPTDAMGNRLGAADEDDWRTDDDWSNSVYKLFEKTFSDDCGTHIKNASTSKSVEPLQLPLVLPAYPNPASYLSTFQFSFEEAGKLQLLLVSESKDIFGEICDQVTAGSVYYYLSLDEIYERGQLYRVFYRFEGTENTYLGHGDIMVE